MTSDSAADSTSTRRSCCTSFRVRGFVTPEGFRESLGSYPAEILAELVAAGQVRHIEKRDMYGLLPPGKERQETLIDEYAGADVRPGSRRTTSSSSS